MTKSRLTDSSIMKVIKRRERRPVCRRRPKYSVHWALVQLHSTSGVPNIVFSEVYIHVWFRP